MATIDPKYEAQISDLGIGEQPLNIARTSKLWVMVRGIAGGFTFHKVLTRATYLRGSVFAYKYNKKICYTAISRDYVIPLVNKRPTIPAYEDLVLSTNLFGERPNAPGEELAILIRTHMRAQATKAIAGKAEIPWKTMLIVLGVVVIAVVAYVGIIKPMQSSDPLPATPTPIGGSVAPAPTAPATGSLTGGN